MTLIDKISHSMNNPFVRNLAIDFKLAKSILKQIYGDLSILLFSLLEIDQIFKSLINISYLNPIKPTAMKLIVNLLILILLVNSNGFGQFQTFRNLKPSLTNDPNNIIYGSTQASHKKFHKQVSKALSPTDCEGSWTNQSGPYGISGAYSVATDLTGNLVLAGANSGIVRSVDGGDTWQYIGGFSNINGQNGQIGAIAIDPVNSNKIIAGEGNDMFMKVYVSEDAGLTWTTKNHPSSEMCIDISLSLIHI